MKNVLFIMIPLAALMACGCDNTGAVKDVPNPDRVERKPFEQMTKEEKITFINRTPMAPEAKEKQIQLINEGKL